MLVFIIRRGMLFLFLGILIISITFAYAQSSSPTESFSHQNTRTVVIDPGHGTPDGGAVSSNGTIESTLNLQIAKKVAEELQERGYNVVMTRKDENGLDKKKRTDMNMRLDLMKSSSADIFVSIHINKFHQSKYRGTEVLYSNNYMQSTLLAQLIMDEIKTVDPKNQTRSIKEASNSLFLMKNATIPAVIVECGFLSNPEEEKLLKDKTYQTKLAVAICDGIIAYYKNVEKTQSNQIS